MAITAGAFYIPDGPFTYSKNLIFYGFGISDLDIQRTEL